MPTVPPAQSLEDPARVPVWVIGDALAGEEVPGGVFLRYLQRPRVGSGQAGSVDEDDFVNHTTHVAARERVRATGFAVLATYTPHVPRQTVKLLLVDERDRLLLIHAKDPRTGREAWYPVGGGIEPGESPSRRPTREADEETGLEVLPRGTAVWFRDDTYRFDGRVWEVHEEWPFYSVPHFDPAPAALSEVEARRVKGFRWWSAAELMRTTDTVFPAGLRALSAGLLRDGPPDVPSDVTSRSLAVNDSI